MGNHYTDQRLIAKLLLYTAQPEPLVGEIWKRNENEDIFGVIIKEKETDRLIHMTNDDMFDSFAEAMEYMVGYLFENEIDI